MSSPIDREVAVFSAARRLPAGERAAYLDEVCAGNAELRERVEQLLRASEEAQNFLQGMAPGATGLVSSITEKAGDKIGRYKLLQQIGEGGCGIVYMAEQEEPVRRRVALKVIKLGMDTKQVVARFEAERQALALMDHPNIAKVLDAGATEAGRPYFVMELVKGVRITDYCDQNNLPTIERLDLFTQVCHAIQHAHQKGIIHRDIKPSNILVTMHDGVPVPKVIDFGIAKATDQRLTDKTLFTAFEQLMGTPAYMSPEQAEMSGLDIDTRSDIYALGVLLYELLTGKTPFDPQELLASGLDAMRRTIREQEPARPSTRLSTMLAADLSAAARHRQCESSKLTSSIQGDLDWIVMKALEKDRARRYETANGLGMDIQRHLNNEPVVARPPSKLYRFQKSVQRNKLAFGAAAAVAIALVIGLAVSTAMYFKAQAEKKKAQTEAAKSQQVAQFLKDMLKGVGPSVALGRDTTMLREIVDKTSERIGKDLTNHPEVEVELRNTIGFAYWELGQWKQAESMYRRSLELMRKVSGNEHAAVAATLHNLAELLRRQGKHKDAETAERQALAIYEKLYGTEHPAIGASLNSLGFVLRFQRKLDEAETVLRRALAMNRKLLGAEDAQVGISLNRLSSLLAAQGKLAEAERMYRDAAAVQKKLLDKEALDLNPSVELAWTLSDLAGDVLQRQGRMTEAIATQREALAIIRTVLSDQHPDVKELESYLSELLKRQGNTAALEALKRETSRPPKPDANRTEVEAPLGERKTK